MNTKEFNKAVKPLSDKWTDDLVKAELYYKRDSDEGILESCNGTDDAIREEIIKHIESCRKCNSTEIDTVVAKQKEELNDLKKELDNSKFGSQCIIHELEYDKKTLIKDNEKLTNLLNEAIGLADIMSDEINNNWCKESKLAVGKLNLIIEKSGWIRPLTCPKNSYSI